MAEPFLGEIRMMSFNYPPKGWAFCNGQFLPINQNQALFSLLGTTFGGNGQTTFALPNLQGRVPVHVGSGLTLGETGGEQNHTISSQEMPTHTHVMQASQSDGNSKLPSGDVLAAAANLYGAPGATTTVTSDTVSNLGGSQAHLNMQPYLAINFCIAISGGDAIFPSPN